MSNIIHIETRAYPLTEDQVKARHPETLFPYPFELCDGYAFVSFGTMPPHDPATQRVVEIDPVEDGGEWRQAFEVVQLTTEELAQRAAAAAAALEAARIAKNTAINDARLAANFSTFTHAGKVFACDQLSRSDIDGTNGYVALYGVLPAGWPGGWKAVDNTYTAIADVAAWKSLYSSMFAAGNANFAHAQAIKQALAAAQTIEEVEAIQW